MEGNEVAARGSRGHAHTALGAAGGSLLRLAGKCTQAH
jgi:hypothetical protein